ncbi:MAG: hypothetical protein Gaeavirus3_11 [Gaeavirus sp.]|uniref:Uncharacterized protein n=1 Tax=Gaeavirus sp. TaxID=2487767 RepID=A0A3G4ZYF9_9VIRU|nr:MAG: hypothetical protein Gaeavirus3_11 [Gaeavirus sp.]
MTLNHPWFIYPQEPLSEYVSYNIYRSEITRLYDYIRTLDINSGDTTLTNFVLGTPMEAAIHAKETTCKFQWQQLYPSHINEFIFHHLNSDKPTYINLIIISPDELFMDKNYKEPLFLSHTDYEFTKIRNREYISKFDNVTINVNIFTCPFPHLDIREDIYASYDRILEKNNILDIETFKPSNDDNTFVNEFYEAFERIAISTSTNPNHIIIVNSYVAFRNISGLGGYALFPKLLEIANKYKIICTEWNMIDSMFTSKIISSIEFNDIDCINNYLTYLDADYCCFIISEYKKIETNTDINNYYCPIEKPRTCLTLKFPLSLELVEIEYM